MKTFRYISLYAIACCLSNFAGVYAQLNPSITSGGEPANSAAICPIPVFSGSFYNSGLSAGTLASDFTLYGLNGDSLHLGNILASGKPLLLVNGSLTCPVFRNRIPELNQMATIYGNQIEIAVVFTVEAHPTDISPYFGYVNITSQNQQEGILYPQPLTYGDRKTLAQIAVTHTGLTVPVYLDRPCQEWWQHYGPAPNNAYVFMPNGEISVKHGWFHRSPDNMFCDLDSILGIQTGACLPSGSLGNFKAEILNVQSFGLPGDILYSYLDLIAGPQGKAEILIMKLDEQYAPGWSSAFCADICYSPDADSIIITVPANDTLHFSLDFITPQQPGQSSVRVGFRNLNNPQNKYSFWFEGSTMSSSIEVIKNEHNRITHILKLGESIPSSWGNLERIYTLDGRMMEGRFSNLPQVPGHYIAVCEGRAYRVYVTP
jgi:hypothetical protein